MALLLDRRLASGFICARLLRIPLDTFFFRARLLHPGIFDHPSVNSLILVAFYLDLSVVVVVVIVA
jgi:hypothetical protein